MATVTEIGKKQFELLSRNITFKAKVKNNQEEMKKRISCWSFIPSMRSAKIIYTFSI
ncbi:hypothetical protein [Staphylococcus ureilyticus]|uniref:hypothetical protein n=1 Tax=Staphylococcus ureilyticus TaxID=94138 RepID=UPI0021D27BBA|nr:hypothetical protein [Staphylococcus ureilyticus]UXS59938.1 hypothetical protein MUA21_12700 [Staphylococcus ureilyticus]